MRSVRASSRIPAFFVGAENTISDITSHPWLESGAAIGYSPDSQRFYVAWMTYPTPTTAPAFHLAGRLVGLDGAPISGIQTLSSGLGRDPGVACNPSRNEFGVSFNGENSAGTSGFSAFARVSAVDGSFTRQTFNFIPGFTFISDIDYNPNTGNYVMAWWQHLSGGGDETHVAELDAIGNIVTTGLVTTQFAGYNSLALAFNLVSGTFALVSLPSSDQVYAAELNARGFRTSALTEVGPGVHRALHADLGEHRNAGMELVFRPQLPHGAEPDHQHQLVCRRASGGVRPARRRPAATHSTTSATAAVALPDGAAGADLGVRRMATGFRRRAGAAAAIRTARPCSRPRAGCAWAATGFPRPAAAARAAIRTARR